MKRAGFYERRVFPWLNDKLTACPDFLRMRGEALAPARGRVVEIGFGSGGNLAYYPSQVQSIVGVEPNTGMWERAKSRLQGSRIPVEVVIGQAENLPLPDGAFDTAVSILTLCSVSDPSRAIPELLRVLRHDGKLIVVEHGLSEEPGVARWQHRLNPLQRVLGCGCNLNRPVANLIRHHGFVFENLRTFYAPGAPRTHGWISMGTARKSSPQAPGGEERRKG
jgi:SAM-dependent methyltransferase